MAIDVDRRTQMPAVRVEQPAAREVVFGELHAQTQQAPVVFAVRLALQEGKDHVRAETFDDFHGAIDARSFRLADVGHRLHALTITHRGQPLQHAVDFSTVRPI